jgi:hypothetical protein
MPIHHHDPRDRREFLRATLGAGTTWALGSACLGQAPPPAPFTLSRVGCGRATAYCESNKIVTLDGRTHVAWLDSEDDTFLVRARTLDQATGTWSEAVTVGEAFDNHGGPALAVDGAGHLHVVYHPHQHPFRYRRSLRPNDASAWTDETRFGTACTYPALVCMPDDTLVLACREQAPSGQRVLNLYRKPAGGDWSSPRTLVHGAAPRGYARWQAALALDPTGRTLHMNFMLLEGSKAPGRAVAYWRSHDAGDTWERSDGTRIETPATPATIEIIAGAADNPEQADYRSGNIAVDAHGVPWIIYARLDRKPCEAWLASCDPRTGWRTTSLLPTVRAAWPDRVPQTPGQVTFDDRGTMYVALTTAAADVTRETHWGHASDRVAVLVSRDGGATFEVVDVPQPDTAAPNWLPSLERPTRHVPIGRPSLAWTHGEPGADNLQTLANQVLWQELSA